MSLALVEPSGYLGRQAERQGATRHMVSTRDWRGPQDLLEVVAPGCL